MIYDLSQPGVRGCLVGDNDGTIPPGPEFLPPLVPPASLAMLAFTNCMSNATWSAPVGDNKKFNCGLPECSLVDDLPADYDRVLARLQQTATDYVQLRIRHGC